MRVAVLYQSNTEHERSIIEFEREYERRTGRSLDLYDMNSRDGWSMASLYDIVAYPTIIALADDGSMLHMWDPQVIPLINEVTYYAPAR